MFSKMKYSIFLFLQLFMLTTSLSNQVWIIQKDMKSTEIAYHPKTRIDQKEAYVFYTSEAYWASVMYVIGAQTKPFRKYIAATRAVNTLKTIYEAVPRGINNLFFRRITSDSRINRFADVQKWEHVFEKILRLYVVWKNEIFQAPLDIEIIFDEDTYLLHDGSTLTVYYSHSSNKKERNLAKSFADYIVKFEKKKHYVDTHISEFDGKKNPKTDFEKFVEKVKEIVEIHHESKINSLQENDVGNSETINEDYAKLSIAYDEEDEEFEKLKERFYEEIGENIFPTCTDKENYERTSSSARASTSSNSTSSASASTAPSSTGRKNKAKQRTKRKGKKDDRPAAGAIVSDPNFMSKRATIIFGPPVCFKKYRSVLSSCVYVTLDILNFESFIYFGRDKVDEKEYKEAVAIAELFLDRYPSAKVSYIVDDGNLLPPSFIMLFKNELKNKLNLK